MRKLNKGSALLITLMVLVVLSLTGLSFIFLADTENAISNNYYKAMSTLVAGQTGVYLVNSWFNTPSRTADLVPKIADLQFNTRTEAENEAGADTLWKNGGAGDFVPFDKPYIGQDGTATVYNQFFGSETAPDVEIALGGNGDAYLTAMNTALFGVDAPTQIASIRLYAPPVAPYPDDPTDPRNQAYAICTALVEARNLNPSGDVVSTRRVRGIITDINYSVAGEALDVDGVIDVNGSVRTHWGNIKSTESIDDNNVNFAPPGGPYYVGPTGTVGYCATLMQTYDSGAGAQWPGSAVLNNSWLQDPWLLVRSRLDLNYSKHGLNVACGGMKTPLPAMPGQALVDPVGMKDPTVNTQNITCDYYYNTATDTLDLKSYLDCSPYNPTSPTPCGAVPGPQAPTNWIAAPADNINSSFTNYWGCDPTVAFATAFRGYNYWKRIVSAVATQGGGASQTSHYLVPGGAAAVNGKCPVGKWGPPGVSTVGTGENDCKDFDDWTNDKSGFWFFDTTDGMVPKKDRSNLAEEDSAKGQWSSAGMIYLCSVGFTATGGSKGNFNVCFPGEPLWENPDPALAEYVNGSYDDKITVAGNTIYVDRFLNLEYPTDPYDGQPNKLLPYKVNSAYEDATRELTLGWDRYGPERPVVGMFHGIFYVTGDLRGAGDRAFWGSVMVWNGSSRIQGTCDVWYDPKLKEGVANLGLPNAYIEQILTDM